MAKALYQVFVSSTYMDLIEERQLVSQTVLQCGCYPVGMEFLPAFNDSQWEFVKQVIDDSDIFLVIIGGRYGSIQSSENPISYVEMEYDYAKKMNKRIIPLVCDNIEELPAKKVEKSFMGIEQLKAFIHKVENEQLVKFWSCKSDLKNAIITTLILQRSHLDDSDGDRDNKEDYSKYNKDAENMTNDNKVFIVHGHDDLAKVTVARSLERMGFEAVILHEQPDEGKTIIEKIETYSNVSFAVVLYTECDVGRDKTKNESENRKRARQNVVFEHGYLMGKLGRKRVCALVKGNVETPGDISGVVYTPMDDKNAWEMSLYKNMRAVGMKVDLNNLS